MTRTTPQGVKSPEAERLRRELLKLIVKNEATRRDDGKAQDK